MGRHEHGRGVWLITPLLLFAFLAVVFGSTSLRAKNSADRFNGPTATADATVVRYDDPSLAAQIFSKFAEGTFLVRFRVETGEDIEVKLRAALAGPPEPAGAVLPVQYVLAEPATARLVRGAQEAKEDAKFYGVLACLSLLVVAVLMAIELLTRRRRTRG